MRNLLIHLRARSAEELRQIADCWGVLLTGRTADDHVAHLYRTMRDPWTVRDRAETLGPAEWALIEAILALPAGTGLLPDAASAATGLPEAQVAPALAALLACGILATDGTTQALGLPRELATAFGRVRDERLLGSAIDPTTPLRGLLSTLEGGELEEAAEAWGLRVTPGTVTREALTDDLLARLDLPEQRRAVITSLADDAARVFAALRAADGRQGLAALREDLKLTAPALREALRALNRRLLVWHVWASPAADGTAARTLIVPRDVLARRRPPQDEPPPLAPVVATPPDRPQQPFSAAWDLLIILQRLAQGRLAWREGDEERNATALRRLAPALWQATAEGRARPGYVSFLLALARSEGLLRIEEEELLAHEPALEGWRGRDFADQTRTLLARWRTSAEWPEGLGQDDLQLTNVAWPAVRGAVLAELRACTVGTWYDAATLATRIARLRPQLLGGSFHAARASGPAGTREEVTAAAVSVILHGALVPLGLLREGAATQASKRAQPALALTEVGAWLLGQGPAPPSPATGDRPLAVGADFEVLLFRPTPRRLWALGALAEQLRLDTVSTYRLTATAVQRGIASGLTAEQVVTFLERGSGGELPQNVAFTLREWTRGHEGVRLGHALVLRPDTAATLDRLRLALERAKLPAPEPLADGRFLLTLPAGTDPESVASVLREAGFAPRWVR